MTLLITDIDDKHDIYDIEKLIITDITDSWWLLIHDDIDDDIYYIITFWRLWLIDDA